MGWYVKRGEAEKGPYEFAQLARSLRDGSLKGSTLVREEGREAWSRADRVVALNSPSQASFRESEERERREREAATRQMRVGAGLIAPGAVATLVAYVERGGRGSFVGGGAMFWGLMWPVKGYTRK